MAEQPIAFQSYQSRAASYSNQRLINLYYEMGVDGTKTPGILYRRPGLELITTLGSDVVRGIHVMNGMPFIVAGTLVYTLDQAGVATVLPGNVLGTDIVNMADNGDQVAIVAGEQGYIATTSAVTLITDINFRSVSSVEFQDGYFIWTEKDSARFFLSALFDGFVYDSLDFATAEYGPDNLVRVFSDHGDLFLFGSETIEVWRNTGDVDFPYSPLAGAAMEVGVISRNTVAKIDNSVCWFGQDERGGIGVWRANGYTPQRISTHALETRWDELVSDLNQSYAFTMRFGGHAFYILTVRNRGTWAYNAATELWCEWQTNGAEDWTLTGFGAAYNWRLVGDREGANIYNVTIDAFDDNGLPIIWQATSPPVSTENNALARHNFVRVDAKTGVGLTNGGDPEILLSWADESGDKFNSPKLMSLGSRGDSTKRMYRRRLGQGRSRTYRIQGADPVDLALIGAYLDVEGGAY